MERRRLTRKKPTVRKRKGAFRNFRVRNAPFLLGSSKRVFFILEGMRKLPKTTRLVDPIERVVERQEPVGRGEKFQNVRDAFRTFASPFVDAL